MKKGKIVGFMRDSPGFFGEGSEILRISGLGRGFPSHSSSRLFKRRMDGESCRKYGLPGAAGRYCPRGGLDGDRASGNGEPVDTKSYAADEIIFRDFLFFEIYTPCSLQHPMITRIFVGKL